MMFHEPIKFCDYKFVLSILDTMLELTEIIHSEKSMDTTYREVMSKISKLFEWDLGELWVIDEKVGKLVKSPVHFVKDKQLDRFTMDSQEITFSLNEGLPGRTWEKKKHIWVQNVQTEPSFIRSELAKACELKTGVTIPILAYDHVEAIMFFFSREELNYDPLAVQVLEHLAQNIGLSIIKRNLELQVEAYRGKSDINELGYPILQRLFLYRDPYTMHHQQQVANLAMDIAKKLGYDEKSLYHIRTAALIHDIGKISVPMEILSKPGKLTQAEFSLIREHPSLGYEIIKNIDLHPSIKRIVLEHHEHLDGSGYPNQLVDHEILGETKILTVADVVCAMLESRPYRTARTKTDVKKELLKFRGTYYSPEVVDVALDLLKGLRIEQNL